MILRILVQITKIPFTIFEIVTIEKHFSRPFQQYIVCHHYQKIIH